MTSNLDRSTGESSSLDKNGASDDRSRNVIFDLDGTLVQTESLKALSYARAAIELCPGCITESEGIEAFKKVVGLSRQEVAERLTAEFGLSRAIAGRLPTGDVPATNAPWQVFVQVRLQIYEALLADAQILFDHLCPFNVALLRYARQHGCGTGLATMSHRPQAQRVLETLDLSDLLDSVATRDDVVRAKPDPEIYELVMKRMGVLPAHSLVIEDSVAGVTAALAAGTRCIVVTNDFTRASVLPQPTTP